MFFHAVVVFVFGKDFLQIESFQDAVTQLSHYYKAFEDLHRQSQRACTTAHIGRFEQK